MTDSVVELALTPAHPEALADPARCFHCGDACRATRTESSGKTFCCAGCQTVFDLLTENGLQDFYTIAASAGVKIKSSPNASQFTFLDEPSVQLRVVDFADDQLTRVRFRAPSIHCAACVWLLENLFRLRPGIAASRVNFGKKEVWISFAHARIRLSEVASLLDSLGYTPDLNFADLNRPAKSTSSTRLYLQLGVAGFSFANIMLFGISSYLGLDETNTPGLRSFFGYTSLALSIPVFVYSAGDYWKSAWVSLKGKFLTIDVPIAIGLVAFFLRSIYEVLRGGGLGYLDSLTGLIFFLLCGKWFQQKTFDRLAFDRDYRSFFPLSVTRRKAGTDERVALSQIETGDHLIIKNGEIIPADAVLATGDGVIDYSFVTGESEPAARRVGDHLYAGGRQCAAGIEVVTVKEVSQSYLTSLWGQKVFQKAGRRSFASAIDAYSRRFTKFILAVAAGAAAFWILRDPRLALPAAISVLIVACPCALALAAPFGFGAAQRILARRGIFLKSPLVVETLAQVDCVVFDKTGTLSAPGSQGVKFTGTPLTTEESAWLLHLTRQSAHPAASRIGEWLLRQGGAARLEEAAPVVRGFAETPGGGVEASIDGHELHLGSAHWLSRQGIELTNSELGVVDLAVDRSHRGAFLLTHGVRPEVAGLLGGLAVRHELALLSGDTDRERHIFEPLFGPAACMRFQQSPLDKLNFIQARQNEGKIVMMVGDGLNDAGALQQSDVGVAVMENLNGFSPASDVIIASSSLPKLEAALKFSRATTRVVRLAFGISAVYNLVGLSIAARGLLSPLTCAILMPLSSITVVAFACGATFALSRFTGWTGADPSKEPLGLP